MSPRKAATDAPAISISLKQLTVSPWLIDTGEFAVIVLGMWSRRLYCGRVEMVALQPTFASAGLGRVADTVPKITLRTLNSFDIPYSPKSPRIRNPPQSTYAATRPPKPSCLVLCTGRQMKLMRPDPRSSLHSLLTGDLNVLGDRVPRLRV